MGFKKLLFKNYMGMHFLMQKDWGGGALAKLAIQAKLAIAVTFSATMYFAICVETPGVEKYSFTF